MNGNRLALVAEQQRLADDIQAHLRKALGQTAFHCRLDTVRNHLSPRTDGVLLLAPATRAEAEEVVRLVHEIALRRLPPVVVVAATEEAASLLEWQDLDPLLHRRLRWPADADALVRLLRERLPRLHAFLGTERETVLDVIRRRLLNSTPSLVPLVDQLALVAVHDVTVLLTGETGTGKSHLGRLMHDCSPRAAEPFLTVPCGALPANLVETTFFGHTRGAFTGADRTRVGKFEAAGKGTILLDEIDTLPVEAQADLLRVIETGEYEPVGSNETQRCLARIIVASNWDLETAARQGKFRQDLYYRLNVMSFHLPPLRERVQDIAPLVRGMAARFNTKFRKTLTDVSPAALAALEAFPWPGNIRQLENVVQQAVLVSSGRTLLPDHLPPSVREHRPAGPVAVVEERDTLKSNRKASERQAILQALQAHNFSRTRAANALGISRVTLYKKMKEYGLFEGATHN